ncbi:hypothetical protein ACFX2C_028803 [Malus domestica]
MVDLIPFAMSRFLAGEGLCRNDCLSEELFGRMDSVVGEAENLNRNGLEPSSLVVLGERILEQFPEMLLAEMLIET